MGNEGRGQEGGVLTAANSVLLLSISSIEISKSSSGLLLKTCFPIHFIPTNFLLILIGSQFNNLLKKVLKVVPSNNGKKPAYTNEYIVIIKRVREKE